MPTLTTGPASLTTHGKIVKQVEPVPNSLVALFLSEANDCLLGLILLTAADGRVMSPSDEMTA